VIVVNVLGNKHIIDIILKAMFLELTDDFMANVSMLIFAQINKVIVPFPHSFRLFCEKTFHKESFWVSFTSIVLPCFPKPFLTSKSWHPTRST
jgi:hypothetical protein